MTDEQIKKKEIESASGENTRQRFFGNHKGVTGGFGLP